MTNEQRFKASCESVGEAYVRQKLIGGRYSEPKTAWANNWLEQLDTGKSDATKADERARRLPESTKAKSYFGPVLLTLMIVLLLGGMALFMKVA